MGEPKCIWRVWHLVVTSLHANCFNTFKAVDFKFHVHVPAVQT